MEMVVQVSGHLKMVMEQIWFEGNSTGVVEGQE